MAITPRPSKTTSFLVLCDKREEISLSSGYDLEYVAAGCEEIHPQPLVFIGYEFEFLHIPSGLS